MIELVDANKKYMKGYKEAYLIAIDKMNQGLISKHDQAFENPDEIDVVQKYKDSRDKLKIPEGKVVSYNYFLVDEDEFLGVIHIRMELNEALLRYAGNIGYGINPKYWNQGYGNILLKLGLEKAKELGLKDKVLITCDDDNIASAKIIEKNGGILENKIQNTIKDETFLTRRYWVKL